MSDAGGTGDVGPAKVETAHLEPVNTLDILNALPERDKKHFAFHVMQITPEGQAAARLKRRDSFRILLTIIVVVAIVAEAGVALYLVEVEKSISWDTLKDWLTLAIAPLTAVVGGIIAFWFPSRESD